MAEKIKIMHVIDSLEHGGAQEFLFQYLKAFDKTRFEVEICGLVGMDRCGSGPQGIANFVLSPDKYNIFKIVSGLYNILKTREYDIIHLHLYFSKLLTRIIIQLFFKKKLKVIVHEHNSIDFEFARYFFYPVIKIIEKILYSFTDMVICNSEYTQNFYIDKLNYRKDNCKVIYNGIDFSELDKEETSNGGEVAFLNICENAKGSVFGFLSRLHYQKGAEYLIRAFASFLADKGQNKGHILLIAGDGPEARRLARLTRDLKMEDSIFFVGKLVENKKIFYQNINCFILPSIYEPFGIVLLEALYFKVPIIASRIGGIVEILKNGRYGFLVKDKDVPELAGALYSFAKMEEADKGSLDRIRESGFEYVKEHFSIKDTVKQLEDVYIKIYGGGRDAE